MKTPETEAPKDGQPSGLVVAPCSAADRVPVLVASWREVFLTCEEQIRYEATAFKHELSKRWPVGTEISFWFTSRAKNCTIGTVIGHLEDGRLLVELQALNRRGYRSVKRVPWRQIS